MPGDKLQLLLEAERRGLLDDRNKALLNEARRRKIDLKEVPHAPDAGSPEANIEYVKTREGDVVPVFRAKAKVLTGYINGRPVYGTQYQTPPKGAPSSPFFSRVQSAFTHDPEAKREAFVRGRLSSQDTRNQTGLDVLSAVESGVPRPVDTSTQDADKERALYRTTAEGEVLRKGADGRYYSLNKPRTPGGRLTSAAASVTADLPNFAAETAGLAAGGVPGLVIAAGGTEVGKRLIAKKYLGERQTIGEDYILRPLLSAGTAAVMGVTGKYVSKGTVSGANKLLRGIEGTGEVGRIVKNSEIIDRAAILRRGERFERFGVRADTGRVVQSSRLGAVQQDLGTMAGEAGDVIRAGDRATRQDVTGALTQGRGGLPALNTTPTQAGRELVDAARSIEEGIRSARRNQANRLYAKAFKEAGDTPIDIQSVTKELKERLADATGDREKVLRELYNDLYKKKIKPGDRSISKLDDIQKRWRIKAKKFSNSRESRDDLLAAEIGELREKLITSISDVSPAYKLATQAYKYRSQALEKFEGKFKRSLLNELTKVEKDYVHKAPGMLFDESPELVAATKADILHNVKDGERKWKSIVRGGFQKLVEGIDTKLEIPAETLRRLKAAVTPKQYEAFTEFTKMLKDLKYVPWAERAAGGEGKRVLEEQVGGVGPRVLKRLTFSPYIQSKEWQKLRVSKAAPHIARELSSGSGIKKYLHLRQLPPGSEKWLRLASTILGTELLRKPVARVVGTNR